MDHPGFGRSSLNRRRNVGIGKPVCKLIIEGETRWKVDRITPSGRDWKGELLEFNVIS